MAWNWLGKSGTVLCGSVIPTFSEHLLNGADTKLPTGATEQRKAHITSPQSINKAKQQRVQYVVKDKYRNNGGG